MKTKQLIIFMFTGFFVLTNLSLSFANERKGDRLYRVTITNITPGQIISPPIVFSHDRGFKFFEPGQPASDALAQLAEDGMTGPLEADLLASSSVQNVSTASGPILPGESVRSK